MSTVFPFVSIPKPLLQKLGKPDPGTRIYRMSGSEEDMGTWYDLLCKTIGPSLSPGGVRMYCPVSRAAVHKRTKEGRLSIFLYHPTYAKQGLFGNVKNVRQSPYGYIPLSEVQAWRREIEERAEKRAVVTTEELEGTKPDWDGKHFDWPNPEERPGMLDSLRELGYTGPLDLAMEIATTLLKHGKIDGVSIPTTTRKVAIALEEKERREAAGTELTKQKARKRRIKK